MVPTTPWAWIRRPWWFPPLVAKVSKFLPYLRESFFFFFFEDLNSNLKSKQGKKSRDLVAKDSKKEGAIKEEEQERSQDELGRPRRWIQSIAHP